MLCLYVSVHCRIMLHVPCTSDRYTFASLVEVLKEQGAAQCLGVLSQAGLKSAWDLENCSKSTLRSLIGDVALDSLLATRKYRKAPTRPDVYLSFTHIRCNELVLEEHRSGCSSIWIRWTKNSSTTDLLGHLEPRVNLVGQHGKLYVRRGNCSRCR